MYFPCPAGEADAFLLQHVLSPIRTSDITKKDSLKSVKQLVRFKLQYMEHRIHTKVKESESEGNIGVSRQTRTYFSSGGLATVVIDFKKFSVHYKNVLMEDQETDKRTESQKSKNRTI